MGRAEGQHSDPALIERIGAVVRRDLPQLRLSSEQNARNWGSEDISLMMNRVQQHGGLATYMRVMTPMAGAQHTVTFDFEDVYKRQHENRSFPRKRARGLGLHVASLPARRPASLWV